MRTPWFAPLAFLLLNGCAMLNLRENTRAFYGATVLAGRVAGPADFQAPVIVLARDEQDGRIAHHVRLHEPGGFELIVGDGDYSVLAFADADGDGRPGEGDLQGASAPLRVRGEGMISAVDVTLAPNATHAPLPNSFAATTHSTQAGALLDFDAPIFSTAQGAHAYWAPLEAFHQAGGNIYFVEPYDPNRIPVLFVHGAAGSAADWRAFISALDASRYQAWVFQYPSGAALESMAHLLYWKYLNLKLRYNFTRMHIVAHSMGGLLVRRTLLDHGAVMPEVESFVSISTPWAGVEAAEIGVSRAPAVIPSWRDLLPNGAFLGDLFARDLPPQIRQTLFFSHRARGFARDNGDGAVSLTSQLRAEAQAGASLVLGFDEDHRSILSAPAVVAQTMQAFSDAATQTQAQSDVAVFLAFPEKHAAAPASVFLLVLTSRDASARLSFPLLASGGRLRVPPGAYDATLLAPGFATITAPLIAQEDAPTVLHFALIAQGALSGYIAREAEPFARPAGSFRAPEALDIERIDLSGPATRTLRPAPAEADTLDVLLAGEDAARGASFSFTALPAGDYVLTISARGFAPHVSRHVVRPGAPTPQAAIQMRRAR